MAIALLILASSSPNVSAQSGQNQYWQVSIVNYQYFPGFYQFNAYDMQGQYGTWSLNSALRVTVCIYNRYFDPYGFVSGRRLFARDTLNGISQPCLYTDDHDFSILATLAYLSATCHTVVFGIPQSHGSSFSLRYTDSDGTVTLPYVRYLLTAVLEEPTLPSLFHLWQNYPNPFNPETTFSFAIPKRAHVSLIIFNLVGQQIATLVDEELLPGTYSQKWDANGFAGGVYFARLQSDGADETTKLILLK